MIQAGLLDQYGRANEMTPGDWKLAENEAVS